MAQSSLVPPRSYALKTFGTLALTSEGTASIAQQRQRLALLVLLAATGDRGLSRDQILAYLWPESDAGNARHSLEQLVHATRRALGDTVFSGVNPLSLNADVVSCDLVDFERALGRDDFARAVDLYRGPFLTGFFLDEAPEFERWTETERARLADRYADALRHLAANAEKSGGYATAIGWWRRLVDADPLSSRWSLALMRALVAAGDRAAALQHARVYEALVHQELESAPDPSIVSYVAALRDGRVETAPPIAAAPVLAGGSAPSSLTPAPAIPDSAPGAVSAVASAGPRTRRWTTVGIAVFALVSAAWYGLHRPHAPTLDANKILIVPFGITGGDSSMKSLGEGVVELLAPMLTGEGGLVAVDSRTAVAAWNRVGNGRDATAGEARAAARSVGAATSLIGTLVITTGRLTLATSLVDASGGDAQALQSVSGSLDSLPILLDDILAQLLLRHADVPSRTVPALISESRPALRAYLDGYRAYRQSRVGTAIEAFDRALELDSTFALAGLQLATVTTKLFRQRLCRNEVCRWAAPMVGVEDSHAPGDDSLFDRGVRLAWESRAKLGPRDLPLLEALSRNGNPRATRASELNAALEKAAEAAPDRPDIMYLRGVVMLYQGSAIGYTDAFVQAEALFRHARSLDSAYLPPLARLVDVAAYENDPVKLEQYGKQYLRRDPTSATADFVRWRMAEGEGDTLAAHAISARFEALDPSTLWQIVRASQMSGVALEDADRAMSAIIHRATDPRDRALALFWANSLALNRGRPHAADSLLRLRQELDSAKQGFWQSTTLGALYADGDLAVAEAIARERAQWLARDTLKWATTPGDSIPPGTVAQAGHEAIWDWTRGEMRKTEALAGWLRRHDWTELADVSDMLVATSERRRDAAALRARVDSAARRGCCRPPHQIDLALATAYEMAGNDSAALAVLRRGRWISPDFLATHLLREGRLAARVGDNTGAIRAYEHFLALNADPEPRLRPRRDSIRAEVKRLQRARTKKS